MAVPEKAWKWSTFFEDMRRLPTANVSRGNPKSSLVQRLAAGGVLTNRRDRSVSAHAPLIRGVREAVPGGGVANEPLAARRPVDHQVRAGVAVEVGGQWQIARNPPLMGARAHKRIRARRMADVPVALTRPIDREIDPAIAVEVSKDRLVAADPAPAVGDRGRIGVA